MMVVNVYGFTSRGLDESSVQTRFFAAFYDLAVVSSGDSPPIISGQLQRVLNGPVQFDSYNSN